MITNKQELKQYLLDYYDNDPRITDDLVFKENELLETGFELLSNSTLDNENSNGWCSIYASEQTISKLLDIELPQYHYAGIDSGWFYKNEKIDGDRKDKLHKELMAEIRKILSTKANEFVGDTGCWYLSGWGHNKNNNSWGNLYLFSPNNVALDFMENDFDKAQFILK